LVAGVLRDGIAALAGARWEEARDSLERATAEVGDPRSQAQALDGLAEAQWWVGHIDDAIAARERAHALYGALDDHAAAARIAVWLSREYASLGNDAASRGWLARAETVAAGACAEDATVQGWVALARAEHAADPAAKAEHAAAALTRARAVHDRDLEVLALGRLGLALIVIHRVDDGLARFDEAMAGATGGEVQRLRTIGELCCDLVKATELTGDTERFAQWSDIVDRFADRYGYPPLVGFCACCSAEAAAAKGDLGAAERDLLTALDQLTQSGHKAQCMPPAAKLGEIRVLQGRTEEAAQLVTSITLDGDGSMLLVRARVALAEGDAATAALLAERHIRRMGGDSLLTARTLGLLVDARLAAADFDAATDAVERLEAVADGGNRKVAGHAALERGRVELARHDIPRAQDALERALDLLSTTRGSIDAAHAHLALARLHADTAPDVAKVEAKSALAAFETAGATRDADEAASLLRELGDHSRVGPKNLGLLTKREREVLRLIGQGFTNAEIAERLFISSKTAANHVSGVLGKLNLRSRAEAAAFAVLHPEAAP